MTKNRGTHNTQWIEKTYVFAMLMVDGPDSGFPIRQYKKVTAAPVAERLHGG